MHLEMLSAEPLNVTLSVQIIAQEVQSRLSKARCVKPD